VTKFHTACHLGIALLLAGFLFSSLNPAQAQTVRQRIKSIGDYTVFYKPEASVDDLHRLDDYDLVIIDPSTVTNTQITTLKSRGVLVVAYLSLGEVNVNSSLYINNTVTINPWRLSTTLTNWGGYYIDVCQQGWWMLLSGPQGAAGFLSRGFDGIFMDTVDAVDAQRSEPNYEALRVCMGNLIAHLRQSYPAMLMVQNRGFSVLPNVGTMIDSVMFESLSTTFRFIGSDVTYMLQPDEAQDWTNAQVANLQLLRAQTGMPILALDYAAPCDYSRYWFARGRAQGFGFISQVLEAYLVSFPDYSCGTPTATRGSRGGDGES
jgi:uncharacterized protein (TIGR01370 family)